MSDPNQKCVNSNFHRSGSKVAWPSSCRSPPTKGAGQIACDGTDSCSGTPKFTREEQTMTIKLTR
jgi:hypothetical protein